MRKNTLTCLLTLVVMVFCSAVCQAEVGFIFDKQLKLKSTPLDVQLAKSGRWLYVLTQEGQLRVYSFQGAFIGKMKVGTAFDQIVPGPTDEVIYMKSSQRKSIQMLSVSYNHSIYIEGSPYKGRKDAPIVIVDYTDFQCPYCARMVPIFNELLKRYPDKVKIVYKNYPLTMHPFAEKAASAAMAAHLKGNFWEFHDKLFANYHRMSDSVIDKIRKDLKFNTSEFTALMQSQKVKRLIQQDMIQGQNIGVKSTPTVFVNGKRQKDKRLEGFIEAIEKELQVLKR